MDPVTISTISKEPGQYPLNWSEKILLLRNIGQMVKAELEMKKLLVWKETMKFHRADNLKIFNALQKGKFDSIGNTKDFRKIMNAIFEREPYFLMERQMNECLACKKQTKKLIK